MKKTLLTTAVLMAVAALPVQAKDVVAEKNWANKDVHYVTLQSAAGTLGAADATGDIANALGGWRNAAKAQDAVNSDLTVTDGTWNLAIGGSYTKDSLGTTMKVDSTRLTIQGGTIGQVVGGSGGSDNEKIHYSKSSSSSLTITGGTFGAKTVVGNCPELLVIGGDLLKVADLRNSHPEAGQAKPYFGGQSDIGTVNVRIEGGTFDAAVIGGSAAISYYANTFDEPKDAGISVNVDTVNLAVSGGTFNHPIVAGGFAYNDERMKSTVGVANVTVENVTLGDNADIYAGGMHGAFNNVTEVRSNYVSTVGATNLTVKNATVDGIYGTNVWMKQVKGDNSDWSYTPNKDVTVKTNLTLANATAKEVYLPVGSVTLRAEGEGGFVNVETATLGDDVSVAFEADGAFNDSVAGDVEAAKEAFKFGDYKVESVSLAEGQLVGKVTVDEQGNVIKQVNAKTEALTEKVAFIPQMISRILLNDVRKRLGDIRASEGTHGVWARYNGGEMSGNGMQADFHMVQAGIDTVPVADAPRFGLAFSYAQMDSDNAYVSSEMNSYSLAAYATKMYDNGLFYDVIGRLAKSDTEMSLAANTGKMDNLALSLSGELGWRYDLTESFFVEPSVEATYTYTDADKFSLGVGTYELEATDSLVGRLGVAAGLKCPNNKGDVYVRAAVVHEFMGDTTMHTSLTATGRHIDTVETDGKDTYVEYAIGAQFNVNKNTYVYADIERTAGAEVDEDWRANVGVRYSF